MVNEDLAHAGLHRAELLGVEQLGRLRRGASHAVDDLAFFLGRGVVDEKFEQEAIALGFGERIHAFVLDRVLGREDEKGLWYVEGVPADGYVSLRHHLQKCRLDLRGGAVDLVREHEIRHHRSEFDVEGLAALAVYAGADDVRGDEVGREL